MEIARKSVSGTSVGPPRVQNRQVETLPPGTAFGRYQLIRRLAVGGMAELYLARATGIEGFEKLVALKRILPQYAVQDDFVSMFLDEARLTARIHHANVAAVYDIGRCLDGLFFTMEYVHGEDVRTIMQAMQRAQRALPLEHALSIAIGAAAGLHAAHEQTAGDGSSIGIVHRDVSPSNLLVSYDGCLKLIDFGIAKATSRQTQTRAGTLKGKVAYMSPEQCLGEPLDRRSDVFALGVVLYEMTTGGRLFPADNEYTAMRQIVDTDAPLPSRRRPGYPPELEAIVMRALRRDRDERYGSAEELQLALESFVRARGLAVSTAQLGYFMRELFPERAAARDDRPTSGLTPPRILPLRAGASGSTRVPPLTLDDLPARAPTLEPMMLGDSGPVANDELALPFEPDLDTSQFPAIDAEPGFEPQGEPSIEIEIETPVPVPAPAPAPAPTAAPAGRRWHLPLALALTASISAVIAAVIVMTAQRPAPAAREPAAEAAPAPAPEPLPVTIPIAVPVAEPAPIAAPEPDDAAAPPRRKSRARTSAKNPAASRPATPAKPTPRSRWNSDSALPPD